MWCPRSSRFWDAERIQEQRNRGRNKTTKNGTVLGTSPPSRCFTMNFTAIVLGLKPSGTQKDWRMPKLYPWTSLDACAVCWPVLTPCKDFWKQLPTSLAEYLARGRKYSIKKNKAYRVRTKTKKSPVSAESCFLCMRAKSCHFQTVTSNWNNNWFKATVYVDMLTLY